jgi:hypothetical protein
MPPGYNLDPGEIVVRRVNRSVFYLVPVIFASALIALAGVGLMYAYYNFGTLSIVPIPAVLINTLAAVLVGIAGLMLISALYVFNRNYLVITNMHLIKMEQNGLFDEKTAQLDLSRVQDVTGARHGLFGTIFDYGDIEIETAAAQENFIFRATTGPQVLADQLLQYHEDYLKANPGREIP